jgi:hypothetical protein
LVTNLRQDPWERYQSESFLYGRWWGEKLWTMIPAVRIDGQFLGTFKDYPPSQVSGSLSVEKARYAAGAQSRKWDLTRLWAQSATSARYSRTDVAS